MARTEKLPEEALRDILTAELEARRLSSHEYWEEPGVQAYADYPNPCMSIALAVGGYIGLDQTAEQVEARYESAYDEVFSLGFEPKQFFKAEGEQFSVEEVKAALEEFTGLAAIAFVDDDGEFIGNHGVWVEQGIVVDKWMGWQVQRLLLLASPKKEEAC